MCRAHAGANGHAAVAEWILANYPPVLMSHGWTMKWVRWPICSKHVVKWSKRLGDGAVGVGAFWMATRDSMELDRVYGVANLLVEGMDFKFQLLMAETAVDTGNRLGKVGRTLDRLTEAITNNARCACQSESHSLKMHCLTPAPAPRAPSQIKWLPLMNRGKSLSITTNLQSGATQACGQQYAWDRHPQL
jgi:hypothetical protein